MGTRDFTKMHGLGNDFVVVDARNLEFHPTTDEIRQLADRRTGIGFDQLITLEMPADPDADIFMRIHNADGGEVAACGNATRCVAKLIAQDRTNRTVCIQTAAGLLHATMMATGGLVRVDMGPARTAWREIPLATECDTLNLPIRIGPLHEAVAVNMGNPHAVFFVADVEAIDLAAVGPRLERDELFPERANIGIAQIVATDTIRLRVWERGAGITRACGTGACAAAVAAARRGLTGRHVKIRLDGGDLAVHWRDDGHVLMTGPASQSYVGQLPVAHDQHHV
ncbi:MAG: diaminopimelate epimerase [Alphaproteobacteria bacterium]